MSPNTNVQIYFYVPEANLEEVKEAMFQASAGKLGNYEKVAWQTKGIGQFCPQKGSRPYLGETGKLEKVDEYKVEMICSKKHVKKVIAALKSSHPYEEPAYGIILLRGHR